MRWYYHISGKDCGPVSSAELREQARSHVVLPDTPVRREGDQRWVSAQAVKGLFVQPARDVAEPASHLPLDKSGSRRTRIKRTAIQLCDDIEDAMGIIRGLLEYYDLSSRQIATICEIISPIGEQLRDLDQDLP